MNAIKINEMLNRINNSVHDKADENICLIWQCKTLYLMYLRCLFHWACFFAQSSKIKCIYTVKEFFRFQFKKNTIHEIQIKIIRFQNNFYF